MLRKNENLVKYEGGKAIGGGGFTREATTRLLDRDSIKKPATAGETAVKSQIGGHVNHPGNHSNAVFRKVRSSETRPNGNGIKGGRWRDTW